MFFKKFRLSDLQNRLINHFAKHKQNGSLKGAGLMSMPMQIPVTSVGNAESFPAATSTLDVKSGKKRKANTQDSTVVIHPVLSAVSDATFWSSMIRLFALFCLCIVVFLEILLRCWKYVDVIGRHIVATSYCWSHPLFVTC